MPDEAWSFEARRALLQLEWLMLCEEHTRLQGDAARLMSVTELAAIAAAIGDLALHCWRLHLFSTALNGFIEAHGGGWDGLPTPLVSLNRPVR